MAFQAFVNRDAAVFLALPKIHHCHLTKIQILETTKFAEICPNLWSFLELFIRFATINYLFRIILLDPVDDLNIYFLRDSGFYWSTDVYIPFISL